MAGAKPKNSFFALISIEQMDDLTQPHASANAAVYHASRQSPSSPFLNLRHRNT
jgi:hypothetical protein